jgi:2-alkyl-3-oxoalkanoate reductase
MRVLVTGAGGFLGRHVVAALCRRGYVVRALVRKPLESGTSGWNAANVEICVADLCAAPGLEDALTDTQAVIHLAAQMKGDDASRISNTINGTSRLLNAMASRGVRRLVLASSLSVYDWRHVREILDEESPVETDGAGRDGYAIAKIQQEQLVRIMAERHGWKLTVMRPGAIWGPQAEYPPIIGQSVGSIHVVVAGSRMLPLTHVVNCAEAFAAVVLDEKAFQQTFNVLDEPQISAWQYMEQYLRRNRRRGVRIPVSYGVAMSVARLASFLGKPVLGQKVPGLLDPRRFEARFKPLRYGSQKLKRVLDWVQPLKGDGYAEQFFDDTGSAAATSPAGLTANGWVA